MTVARAQRDPEHERALTRQVAPAGADPIDLTELIHFAEERADSGAGEYGAGFPEDERDLPHEAIEEAADLRNYLVWAIERVERGMRPGGVHVDHLRRALRHTILLYSELRAAEDLG